MTSQTSLKNRIVVVTGASQGLGAAIALKCADEGARVALVARSADLLTNIALKIRRTGGNAKAFVCDLQVSSDIEETVKAILDEYGHIDVLVSNAGIWTDDVLESTKPELIRRAFEVNAAGTISFINAVLPSMRERNTGHLLNVISTAGYEGIPEADITGWKTYGATKWAITGFTRALRTSLHDTKLKVTAFFPGGFDSNLYENADRPDAHGQPWMMKTEDVAEVALFALTRPADVEIPELVVTKKY